MDNIAHLVLVLMIMHVAPLSAEAVDFCDWETFNATCPADHVIAIINARYGRMNLGRCISTNYGSIGCGADVTSHLEAVCSGNRACAVNVISLSQELVQTNAPCPPEFKYYLEADFECLSVYSQVNASMPSCPTLASNTSPSPLPLTGASTGLLASAVTMETGLGGTSCPWEIHVEPYQRINITLLDFSVPPPRMFKVDRQHGSGPSRPASNRGGQQYRMSSAGRGTDGRNAMAGVGSWLSGGACEEYALILEDVVVVGRRGGGGVMSGTVGKGDAAGAGGGQRRNATVCGRRHRQSVVYMSETNVVQIRLSQSASRQYRFVLKYEAFGCPPFVAPPGAWITDSGPHHVHVQCNETSGMDDEDAPKWRLTCIGSSWRGHVGNCSGYIGALSSHVGGSFGKTSGDWEMFSSSSSFPFGILFVIALGVVIGIIAGLLMLFAVLAYMRQRKHRRARRHSSYVIHETDTTGSGHSYDVHAKTGNTACSTQYRQTPIYRTLCQDSSGNEVASHGTTWQRTRPLPVPMRLCSNETGSHGQYDDVFDDEDEDNEIAMTPLTTTSDHPLLSSVGNNVGLFHVTKSSCSVSSSDPNCYAPDAVRSYVASSQQRSNDVLMSTHPSQQQQQLPIDAGRLLVIGSQCADTTEIGQRDGVRGGYERCVDVRDQPVRTTAGGPYYFKLDLTAGLAPSSDEQMTESQCLMCLHQQQQRPWGGGTLSRHQTIDQRGGSGVSPAQQAGHHHHY